jgi:hypothetical protein
MAFLGEPLIQRAMAQVALFDLASRQWCAEPVACGAALAAPRRAPAKRQRTAADEELVTHRRQHTALAQQRANHDMVLATVMTLLDPQDFNVDEHGLLAILATPIPPTRLALLDADHLTLFAPSTRRLVLGGVDCASVRLAQTVALLPRLTELRVDGCSSFAAVVPFLQRLKGLEMWNYSMAETEYLSTAAMTSVCNALNHDGRLRRLNLPCCFDGDGATAAIDALTELVRCSPRLHDFAIDVDQEHQVGDFAKVALAVGQHSALREVWLRDTNLNPAQLYAMLHRHKRLRVIEVDVHMEGRLISALPNLQRVDVTPSNLTEDQTVELCSALRGLRRLTELRIGGVRDCTQREGNAICDAIAGKPLRLLGLRGLTTEVCQAIAYAPDGAPTLGPMRNTLRHLYLERCDPVTASWFQAMLPGTIVIAQDY